MLACGDGDDAEAEHAAALEARALVALSLIFDPK